MTYGRKGQRISEVHVAAACKDSREVRRPMSKDSPEKSNVDVNASSKWERGETSAGHEASAYNGRT